MPGTECFNTAASGHVQLSSGKDPCVCCCSHCSVENKKFCIAVAVLNSVLAVKQCFRDSGFWPAMQEKFDITKRNPALPKRPVHRESHRETGWTSETAHAAVRASGFSPSKTSTIQLLISEQRCWKWALVSELTQTCTPR